MRMHHAFSRFKNIPGTVLGSDVVPAVAAAGDDNVFNHVFFSNTGWPCHRIAVGYNYKGAGSPIALPAKLVVWDDLSQRWYELGLGGAEQNLADGKIIFFDTLGLLGRASSRAGGDANAPSIGNLKGLDQVTSGSEVARLIVSDPGAAPDGEHQFVFGADLSTIGYSL